MTDTLTDQTKLAINGGPKAFEKMTGKSEPKIGVDEFMSVAQRFGFNAEALDRIRTAVSNDDLLGNGAGPHLGRYYGSPAPIMGEQFEALAREKFKVKHAFPVSSGTGALHCAMVAVGAGPGKEVICPAIGFLATAMAAALTGATPVFCDVDESLQIDPDKIEALITPQTVAVAPTHHWGFVCDMAPIMAIAGKYGIKVIEDCAQAPGAAYRGRYVGAIGDIGCFSISSYKIIGGGEGGMMVTSDDRLYERALQMGEGGGLWRPDRFAVERYPDELFPGTNYRLSELESAVDLVQLGKVDDVVARHRTVYHRIRRQLGDFREIRWQKSNDPDGDIGYMLRFYPETFDLGKKITDALQAEGIGASYRGAGAEPDWHVHHYMYPLFGNHAGQCRDELCPVATDLYDRNIKIGLDQWCAPEDCDAIAAGINKVLAAYCTPSPQESSAS